MEEFKFTGEWEFGIDLGGFLLSNENWGKSRGYEIKNDIIGVRIVDSKSYDPDPLEEQLKTLNYIINHQTQVVEALCNAMDKINLKYAERSGDYDWFPVKVRANDLGALFYINELKILTEHKNNFSYYELSASYRGDEEHGLIVVMHQEELIEYTAVGEMDYDGVYKHLGDRAKSFIATNIKNQEFGINQVHQALPKYGKFKPWQLEATSEHLSRLLKRKENERLMQIIDGKEWDINLHFPESNRNFIDMATRLGNLEIVQYLIDRGADFSNTVLRCAGREEVVQLIVENGGSVDNLDVNGKTPFGHEVLIYGFLVLRLTSIGDKTSPNFEQTFNLVKEAEDRLSFYLKMGANPHNCDGKGGDFKSIIGARWSKNTALLDKIFGFLEDTIATHSA